MSQRVFHGFAGINALPWGVTFFNLSQRSVVGDPCSYFVISHHSPPPPYKKARFGDIVLDNIKARCTELALIIAVYDENCGNPEIRPISYEQPILPL